MSGATSLARRGAVVGLILTTACFQSSAPRGWLPRPEDAQRTAFGSWISVQGEPQTPPLAQGELIAIDADTVHILADGRLVSVARGTLCCAVLAAYRMDLSGLQAWWALGTLATLSHGLVLILSAPVWTIAGASSVAAASYAPRVLGTDPETLRPFARFPQGMPPGLDRSALRPKP